MKRISICHHKAQEYHNNYKVKDGCHNEIKKAIGAKSKQDGGK